MEQTWKVNIASPDGLDRWMNFVKTVQEEFHGLDLYHSETYREAVIKNTKRGTALYVQDDNTKNIIGAGMYSPNSMHISWLAAGPGHRRKGIGSALVKHILDKLPKNVTVKVRTFLLEQEPGKAAQGFYKSLGFTPKEIMEDVKNENAGKPFHVFIREPEMPVFFSFYCQQGIGQGDAKNWHDTGGNITTACFKMGRVYRSGAIWTIAG